MKIKKKIWSHPSWVCGLKQNSNDPDFAAQVVTPFVGVWIETKEWSAIDFSILCHTLRGCVD